MQYLNYWHGNITSVTEHGSTMESRAFSKLMVINIAIHYNQWTDKDNKYGYQRNISCKDGLDKGRKWYGPNRSVVRIHRTVQKDLHNPDNHDGVMTHLEPDILECEVKQALGSITTNKASGGDGIPVELFQILKDDAVKVLHSICQQIWKTQPWPQDWKRSVFIPIPKKGNAKECSNYHRIVPSPTLVK